MRTLAAAALSALVLLAAGCDDEPTTLDGATAYDAGSIARDAMDDEVLDEDSLAHVVDRIRVVQSFMERPLAFENPSSYLEFVDSTMTEWEFLARMAEAADCGILLDVNNIYVSCFNHGWDARAYLDGIPWDRVVQFHLAGHTNKGDVIIEIAGQSITNVYDYTYALELLKIGQPAKVIYLRNGEKRETTLTPAARK